MDWETEFYELTWGGQKKYHGDKQDIDDSTITIDHDEFTIDGAGI